MAADKRPREEVDISLSSNPRHGEAHSNAALLAGLSPIPKIDLTEEVVHRFKTLLGEQRLKPGGRLPPERELAALFGISRPSLRHGLKALELLGAIESRRAHGTFVSNSAANVLEEPLALIVLLHSTTFEELHEVRRTVEVELAALAAARATEAELEAIEICLADQQSNINSRREFLKNDLDFHNLIAKASHNNLFSIFLGSLRRLLSEKMQVLAERSSTDGPVDLTPTIEEHTEIVRSLRARDGAAASRAMVYHLQRVLTQWIDLKS